MRDLKIITILSDAGCNKIIHPEFQSPEKRKAESRHNKRKGSAAQRLSFRNKIGRVAIKSIKLENIAPQNNHLEV